VHFRWGDVATHDTERPDFRTGWGLRHLANFTAILLRTFADQHTKVYFICEVKEDIFSAFTSLVPGAIMLLNSATPGWQAALDRFSLSDILIGGGSSFFMLGSMLCDNCTFYVGRGSKGSSSEIHFNPHKSEVGSGQTDHLRLVIV
jgi:hypothetical protein